MRSLDDYLALPYRIVLVHDHDEEDGVEGWVAEVEELPGCMSQGSTPEEAVAGIRDAMAGWISVALEDEKAIPEPRADQSHSGRFLTRMPATLHAQIAQEAEWEGVSLNQFVVSALAGAVAWRHGDARHHARVG